VVASTVVVDTGSVVVTTSVVVVEVTGGIVVVVVIGGVVDVVAGGGFVVEADRGDVVDAPGTGEGGATGTEPAVVGGEGIVAQGPSTVTVLLDTIPVVGAVSDGTIPWRPVVVVDSPASRSPLSILAANTSGART